MSKVADFIQSWRGVPLSVALSLSVASSPLVGLSQRKTSPDPDPANERIESFRAEFVRAPDIGLWFLRRVDRGLIVADVAADGAISKVGFEEGDQILAVNDQKVTTELDFMRSLFAEPVRLRPVKIRVIRDKRELVLVVSPFRLIEELIVSIGEPLEPLGIKLDPRLPEQAVVSKVLPRSPAFYAGLRTGDEIVSFERIPITEPDQFTQLVLARKPGFVSLRVRRGERERFVELEIPSFVRGHIVQPDNGKKPAGPGKQRVDPGGVSPGGEVPSGTPRNRVDPGGISPGGEVPREPKRVPSFTDEP